VRGVAVAAALLGAVSPAFASGWDDALRCPSGSVVRLGDEVATVLDKCGQPAERRVVPGSCRAAGRCTRDREYWRYDFGSTEFIRYLQFNDKRLARIEVGDYGGHGSAGRGE
jgi:hypothetical protein